jgi:FlaA1/EpsC-like NDP-sugar epimerase
MKSYFASTASSAREWWRARLPTREAVIVTALLALLFELTYLSAFFVRGELLLRPSDARTILATIGWVMAIKTLIFYWRGFCHRPWRAARFQDLNKLIRGSTAALFALIAVNYFGQYIRGWVPIPRSVLLLDWVFTVVAVGGMQAIARSLYEEIMPITTAGHETPVLVIDASDGGRALAEALPAIRPRHYFVAGLLDDDPDRYGLRIGRARVLGPIGMAPACAERLRAKEVIVRDGAIFGSRLRALCDACALINVRVRIAENCPADPPGDGAGRPAASVKPIRVRDIQLHDMLARPQAHLDDHDSRVVPLVEDKCVLVTGAGGSIGSEICRQLLRFLPAKVVLVERSEAALFAIHRELTERRAMPSTAIVPLLCDIADKDRAAAVLRAYRPAIVIHAAAFKHLPLMESHPIEAITNNTLATATFADLSAAAGVETFIALSTDKAVYPSSVMGASKLVAERYLEALSQDSGTKFVAVRFGNVLGSSGSAAPIFIDQLTRGLPIKVTHPDVRRYFMTIDEAAQLVILAGAMSPQGGVYVLDMGDPLPIVDLVASIAFVMNVPAADVRIHYCGLRPGEKLDEDLFFKEEVREPTASPLVIRADRSARQLEEVRSWLDDLRAAIAKGPEAAAATLMAIANRDSATLSSHHASTVSP